MEVAAEPRPVLGETVRLVIRDGDPVGTAFARLRPDDLRVTLALEARAVVGRSEAESLVRSLEQLARAHAVGTLEVDTLDSLVRYHLRCCGFRGALRGPLRLELANPTALLTADDAATQIGWREPSRDDIERSVLDLTRPLGVSVRRPRGLGGLVGKARFTDFVADVDGAPTGTVTARVPNRADLAPEAIASILDTATSVLDRFPAGVHRFWCRPWDTGNSAGATMSDGGTVYLDPAYVLADAMESSRRAWVMRWITEPRDERADAVEQPFVVATSRYSDLDRLVAHELWHGLEQSVTRFGGVEFHRALGEALGVDTLEHALSGRAPNAPPEWRAAYERLVSEVSPYAATNPRETKAEMFKLWWRGNTEMTPVVQRFAELVERELPAVPR